MKHLIPYTLFLVFVCLPLSNASASAIETNMFASKPSNEKIKELFPERESWPDEMKCVRTLTKHYDKKVSTLNHRDLYNFDFKNGIWSDFKHKGFLKYLGGLDTFTVTYALHDDGGYLYKIVSLSATEDGIVANRSMIHGDSVFAYWSKCRVIK